MDAIVLGLVEGLTEFLPVSSTGHLILASRGLGLSGDLVDSFNIAIQSGAILAVVIIYWQRFRGFLDWKAKEDAGFRGIRGIILISLTTFPALALAALFHKDIKAVLFAPLPVALALAIGGVLMIWIERKASKEPNLILEKLSYRNALAIGFFQCFSLWPGMSRAAATIIGGRFLGLSRQEAAEYSFLAAVPILIAATAYELKNNPGLLTQAEPLFAVGFGVSFITAWFAVKGFLLLLRRWTLAPFGWYRIVLAAAVFYAL